jgi:hypothetical protein
MTKIENAFDLWLSRLRADDNNVGVFYFCGHGVMVADHYLLAEDFAQSNNKPWANAFDISNTFRAVQREVKGPLYFFVDACRQISRDKAFTLGADPQAIKAVDLNKALICSSSSLIEASGEGKLAFAIEGKVSRFTDALLTAMSGYCGIRSPGTTTWAVDGETLAAAIRKLLESSSKSAAQRQVSDQFISGSSVPLLQLTSVPRVKVELDLLPEAMRALALIYLQSSKGDRFEHDGTKGVFQTEVPRGFYDLGARSASGVFSELTYSDQELVPPLFGLTMQVQS